MRPQFGRGLRTRDVSFAVIRSHSPHSPLEWEFSYLLALQQDHYE
jgi:hypothetical protein